MTSELKKFPHWERKKILEWVNQNYEKLMASNNYIAEEMANLESEKLSLNEEETTYSICGLRGIEALIGYFILREKGVNRSDILYDILKMVKEDAKKFLKSLEKNRPNWDDPDDQCLLFVHKEIRGGEANFVQVDIEQKIEEHRKLFHPNGSRYISLIDYERLEDRENPVHPVMVGFLDKNIPEDPYRLQGYLEREGVDTKYINVSGDEDADEADMKYDSLLKIEDFLFEFNFSKEIRDEWEAIFADSQVFQEVKKYHDYYFSY